MDFIRKTCLNSLNRLGIDEIKADYSFTQCTLLGKAILIKNKIIVDYLCRTVQTRRKYTKMNPTYYLLFNLPKGPSQRKS